MVIAVSDSSTKIHDPQELERQLIARANVGDVDGMVALFEPGAVLAVGGLVGIREPKTPLVSAPGGVL
jgi:hypothetical protein